MPSLRHTSDRNEGGGASLRRPSALAADHASGLLKRLGVAGEFEGAHGTSGHPDVEWAQSGAMLLTGWPGAAPQLAPGPLASGVSGAGLALRALAGDSWRGGASVTAALLCERAAVFGHRRAGDQSPGGSCRLLACRDGQIALNLARPEDRDLLPAWLEHDADGRGVLARDDAFAFATSHVARRSQSELVARARLMGLPVAPCTHEAASETRWLTVHEGAEAAGSTSRPPLVVDLSTLWAGPLCGQLLGLCGARVIKLESLERPDGARGGPRAFFDLLNQDKDSVALDLSTARGIRRLVSLLERADIVIESARPRALANHGIRGEDWIQRRAGLTWVSITGYGRSEPEANWVAFGDDASAAAGLVSATGRLADPAAGARAQPIFCADAIADPITGVHAAVAALALWRDGRSRLLDLSLCETTRHVWRRSAPAPEARVVRKPGTQEEDDAWWVELDDERFSVAAPRTRVAERPAAELGADTERILGELEIA